MAKLLKYSKQFKSYSDFYKLIIDGRTDIVIIGHSSSVLLLDDFTAGRAIINFQRHRMYNINQVNISVFFATKKDTKNLFA